MGHWYEAQLIHYGLPPSKDKAKAKIRLLEALNASALVVPAHIVTLEAFLRKKYEAAERRAKAQYKAGLTAAAGGDQSGPSKKRKTSDSAFANGGSTVNVNINLGVFGGMPNGTQFGGLAQHQQEASPREEGRRSKRKYAERACNQEGGLRQERNPTVKKASPVEEEPVVKMEPTVEMEPRTIHVPLGLINGYYAISCPILESDFNCYNLSIILCLDTPRVWGAYNFGPFTGILHLPQRPFQASDDGLLFRWRGIDHIRGEIGAGDFCMGEIAFLGHGRIAGRLNIYGDCEFTGMRQTEAMNSPRSAYSMRQEWESYNEGDDAY